MPRTFDDILETHFNPEERQQIEAEGQRIAAANRVLRERERELIVTALDALDELSKSGGAVFTLDITTSGGDRMRVDRDGLAEARKRLRRAKAA